MRLDNDMRNIKNINYNYLMKLVNKDIEKSDFIIISDYNKGVCEESLLQGVISKANRNKIPIIADPKGLYWEKYSGVSFLTPNTKEIESVLKLRLKSDLEFEIAGRKVLDKFNIKSCIITRGADGMSFVGQNNILHQKVGKKEVYDVSESW